MSRWSATGLRAAEEPGRRLTRESDGMECETEKVRDADGGRKKRGADGRRGREWLASAVGARQLERV